MLRIGLLLALTVGTARAQELPRPVLLLHPALSHEVADALTHEANRRGFDVAAPAPQPEPASEALLTDIRPLYQNMSFGPAVRKLEAAEASLIDGRLPTLGVIRALSDVELWMGACLFLARDRAAAEDRWALAQRLRPSARPDAIFPPEVQKAFSQRRSGGKPVPVAVKLAPAGTRLWVDGRLLDGPLLAVPGLHYVVAERADQQPSAQVLRIIHATPQIAVSLQKPAERSDALRQAHARFRTGALSRDEALGVSAALERPLYVVDARAGQLVATRYAAADTTRTVSTIEDADAAGLITTACANEACTPIEPPPPPTIPTAVVIAPPPPPAPPKKAVWKRGWFWGVVGTSVALAAGAAVGITLGLTAPRDYDLHVR